MKGPRLAGDPTVDLNASQPHGGSVAVRHSRVSVRLSRRSTSARASAPPSSRTGKPRATAETATARTLWEEGSAIATGRVRSACALMRERSPVPLAAGIVPAVAFATTRGRRAQPRFDGRVPGLAPNANATNMQCEPSFGPAVWQRRHGRSVRRVPHRAIQRRGRSGPGITQDPLPLGVGGQDRSRRGARACSVVIGPCRMYPLYRIYHGSGERADSFEVYRLRHFDVRLPDTASRSTNRHGPRIPTRGHRTPTRR